MLETVVLLRSTGKIGTAVQVVIIAEANWFRSCHAGRSVGVTRGVMAPCKCHAVTQSLSSYFIVGVVSRLLQLIDTNTIPEISIMAIATHPSPVISTFRLRSMAASRREPLLTPLRIR